MLAPWKKSYDQPRQHIKKQRHYFANKGLYSQSFSFYSSHVQMWELDHKESWALKNWCFWTVVLDKTLESPLDCKGDLTSQSQRKSILNIHCKDWCWSWNSNTLATLFKNWLLGKDPDAGKDWRQEKGMIEDEMVGWHQWLSGHEFKQALGVGNGQGSLVCCSPWGHKESDMTEWLNWPELNGRILTFLFMCFN